MYDPIHCISIFYISADIIGRIIPKFFKFEEFNLVEMFTILDTYQF